MSARPVVLLAFALALPGCGVPTLECVQGTNSGEVKTTDEIQYLDFVVQAPGLFEDTGEGAGDPALIYAVLDKDVTALIEKLGVTGDGKTRQLGFHYSIPIWAVEGRYPGKSRNVIQQSFNVARDRKVAIHFSLETHYFWDTRPDLFNYFAPSDPSFNPKNSANVEWSDWQGTPNRHRYVNHGEPVELAPHMCYLSAKIQSEVTRLGALVGSAVKAELDALAAAGQSHLFSGLTVTSEPSLDNYTNIDTIDPDMAKLMDKAGAPKVRLGFCSFTAAGFSAANPPTDLAAAAAMVNQKWVTSWTKSLAAGGIPTNRLYTHIAAGGGTPADRPFELLNAPIDIAFADSSRPGWTTYPMGTLRDNFDILYQSLSSHGGGHWGGTESAPFDGRGLVPMGDYLARHYDHGATVVVLNDGARGDLMSLLSQSVYGCDAIAVYQRFLKGP